MHKAAATYLATQVTTTTPGELLIMLYDACLKNLHQAKERIRERNYRDKGMLISKAIDIISELQSCLNAQKGGELAVNLHKLYFYCNTRLLLANMRMDESIVDEVIKIISGIRDAFHQIVTQQGSDASGQSAACPQRTLTPVPPKAAAAPQPVRPAAMAPVQAAPPVAAPVTLSVSAPGPDIDQQPFAPEAPMPPRGLRPRGLAAYAGALKHSA